MICLPQIYDYIAMQNLLVSTENNSKTDISSAHLTGTETGKESGPSPSCAYNHVNSVLNSEESSQLLVLEYLQSLVHTFPIALPISRKI